MAANSKIEWCDHTFNPWVGCTKISPACDHCYAESWAKRTGQPHLWTGERRRTSAANWKQPLAWNRAAEKAGVRNRVFCASLADVFDNQVPQQWRDDLWWLIAHTPHLDWLLLTKRPQNIKAMLPQFDEGPAWPWPNVWLGTTVENRVQAEFRIQELLAVPAAKRFLSCEPLLGPVDLHHIQQSTGWISPLDGIRHIGPSVFHGDDRIHWVICGGESGPGARPMHPVWALKIRDQCQAHGVPFFFKQWGEWIEFDHGTPETIEVDVDSELAESILPLLKHPGWITKSGTFCASLDEIPVDEPARLMDRVGKAAAGAMLDGREWREFPA